MKKLIPLLIAVLFISCDADPVRVLENAYVLTIDVHDKTKYTLDTSTLHYNSGVQTYNNDGSGPFTFKIYHDDHVYHIHVKSNVEIKSLSSHIGNGFLYQPTSKLFQHTVDGSEPIMYKIYF